MPLSKFITGNFTPINIENFAFGTIFKTLVVLLAVMVYKLEEVKERFWFIFLTYSWSVTYTWTFPCPWFMFFWVSRSMTNFSDIFLTHDLFFCHFLTHDLFFWHFSDPWLTFLTLSDTWLSLLTFSDPWLTFRTFSSLTHGSVCTWRPFPCERHPPDPLPQGTYWPPSPGHLLAKPNIKIKSCREHTFNAVLQRMLLKMYRDLVFTAEIVLAWYEYCLRSYSYI